MKLHEAAAAPNCRRVRIFLAEKGIDVPIQPVDIANMENRRPPYTDKNPMSGVPMLELDDGTCIAESVAICRYFEELQPEPPLMGRDPLDKAKVEMWQRRMELEILLPIAQAFRQSHPFFAQRIEQVPAFGEAQKRHALQRMAWLDQELASREFVAGDRYTIADITALVGIDFGRVVKVRIPEEMSHLARWHAAVSSRPSAQA
ncbi:MAG TPA: glutathione S-transferase [Thermoanaerobaculia bacterium]|nr:glutathione S-transferase [Thermoanaerobaculia bacterium]